MRARLNSAKDRASGRVEDYFSRGPVRRILRGVFIGMRDHHGVRAAGAMAFDLFLAMIPLLACIGWLIGRVLSHQPEAVDKVMLLLDLTPHDVQVMLTRQVGRFSENTAAAPLAVLGALWLTSGAFHTVITVFENALHAEPRGWWRKRALSLGCALLLVSLIPLMGWLAVELSGGPVAVLRALRYADPGDRSTVRHVAVVLVIAATSGLVAAFFRVAVRRRGIKRRIWPGAFTTVLIGSAASWGFASYVTYAARYTLFYGSLATVAVLLIWLWICCAALLLGAEVNTQLEGIERPKRAAAASLEPTTSTSTVAAASDDATDSDESARQRSLGPGRPAEQSLVPRVDSPLAEAPPPTDQQTKGEAPG